MWAGDYRLFRAQIVQIGSIETESQFTKSRNWRALIGITDPHSLVERRTGWLGREDSNLRMVESKSTALPLGDAPKDGPEKAAQRGCPRIPSGTAGL
jgi:hypothetical protein